MQKQTFFFIFLNLKNIIYEDIELDEIEVSPKLSPIEKVLLLDQME